MAARRGRGRGASYRPPPRDDYPRHPPSPPRHFGNRDSGFTFRGAADASYDTYRSSYDSRHEFSFRGPGSAPSFQPQVALADRISGAPRQPRGFQPRRGNSANGRSRYGPRPAHEREILASRQVRETTPDQLEGMTVDSEAKFLNIDEAFAAEIAPPAKRTKGADGQAVPRWSNPDPYTVLPPTEEVQGPKKDIVQSIRLAKRQNQQASLGDSAVKENDDFISFTFDEDADKSVEASDEERPAKRAKMTLYGNSESDARPHPQRGASPASSRRAYMMPAARYTEEPKVATKTYFTDSDDEDTPPPDSRKRKRGDDYEQRHDRQPSLAIASSPWFSYGLDRTHSPPDRLHHEITDFYEYVKPRKVDNIVRQHLIQRIMDLLNKHNQLKDEAIEVHAFGSFASGVYLPDADMDLVVLSQGYITTGEPVIAQNANRIRKLADYISRSGLAAQGSVQPIIFARVPLIKFVDQRTGLKVDLSFENASGLRAIAYYNAWKEEFPCLPVLASLIKQLLAMHTYNEVHTGGIGGFTTVCLIVSFLQNLDRLFPEQDSYRTMSHYGDLLMDFLSFYGKTFDYRRDAILMDPPGYRDKQDGSLPKSHVDRLTIIDPNNEDNDVSGGSSKTIDIFRLFYEVRERLLDSLDRVKHRSSADSSLLACCWASDYSSFDRIRDLLDSAYDRGLAASGGTKPLSLPDLSMMQKTGPRLVRNKQTGIRARSGGTARGGPRGGRGGRR